MSWSKAVRVLVAGAVVVGSVAGAGAVSAAAPAPDLVVTAVVVPPGAVAGQLVRFGVTIQNRGTAPTPAGTISGIGFQVDGRLVTWSDQFTAALQPGERVTLEAVGGPAGSATWTATAGRHVLRAVVDDAGRVREADEQNNVRDTSFTVGAGIANRVQGQSVVASLAPLPAPSRTATSVTGRLFGGCLAADGGLTDGSERFLGTRTVGNDTFAGTKWTGGLASVPAGATRVRTGVSFSPVLYAVQGGLPITCAAGQTAAFTRFAATSVRTSRYTTSSTGTERQVASVSTPVDVDLDVVP
ncbi:CARDB domain-containing protein [Kineococcus sp. LSe6-4]|uniref:CARDB domain-containing protein n=1 Tax=Kineococcus halophytocola TaxID=3234027 RepID=A0ABV4H832_9ACTN